MIMLTVLPALEELVRHGSKRGYVNDNRMITKIRRFSTISAE